MFDELTKLTGDDVAAMERVCKNEIAEPWRDELHNAYLRDVPKLLYAVRRLTLELNAAMILLPDPDGVKPVGVLDASELVE